MRGRAEKVVSEINPEIGFERGLHKEHLREKFTLACTRVNQHML